MPAICHINSGSEPLRTDFSLAKISVGEVRFQTFRFKKIMHIDNEREARVITNRRQKNDITGITKHIRF